VKRFARLLEDLVFSPSRNTKLRLLQDYFSVTPDPDRGYALAALTGTLKFRYAKAHVVRKLVEERVDPVLFNYSRDFVGDLAETAALIWPAPLAPPNAPAPSVAEIVEALADATAVQAQRQIGLWFDRLDAGGRWALIKLVTGELRVGVSQRLAKTALASLGKVELSAVEEVWHGLEPPYVPLFKWLEKGGEPPRIDRAATFSPLMLAHALDEADLKTLDPRDFSAEWKWDGIRVQVVARGGRRRLYSRAAEDIGKAFPDLLEAAAFDAVIDGELLVRREGSVGSFNELQQRLNRKTVTPAMLKDYPVFVRAYDILFEADEDLRGLPFVERRKRLERWLKTAIGRGGSERFDLSPLVRFKTWEELRLQRAEPPASAIEGVMLKRHDSLYVGGRPKGPWFKWKRDPKVVDAVLMYAQRGSGKRSSFYSDYTLGCWRAGNDGRELVPVGKAYFGFTDEELKQLDSWVRNHTVNRFGPVREVEKALVLELAFEGVQRSTRHKSGVALRFPRISRIRWDKPAAEADDVSAVEALIGA